SWIAWHRCRAMKVLLLGSTGQLAQTLRFSADAQTDVTALGRPALDIRDETALRAAIERVQPALIINTAAWTAVDAAESQQAEAFAINADAVQSLARICAA